tara:strand:- start:42 stop:458 length:417 start_codon:yes stop_codon:yes gene_type:complete
VNWFGIVKNVFNPPSAAESKELFDAWYSPHAPMYQESWMPQTVQTLGSCNEYVKFLIEQPEFNVLNSSFRNRLSNLTQDDKGMQDIEEMLQDMEGHLDKYPETFRKEGDVLMNTKAVEYLIDQWNACSERITRAGDNI